MYFSFFISRTNLENLADHKWSADRTLGNTVLQTAQEPQVRNPLFGSILDNKDVIRVRPCIPIIKELTFQQKVLFLRKI